MGAEPNPTSGSASTPTRSQLLRFGIFEVDLRTGELRKSGVRIKLHAQPFAVLAMLLEHPGEVVSREEIQKKLWGSDTFVDFEHGLNKAVNKLREALNDNADNPRYIETLSRRGYRFVGPIAPPTALQAAGTTAEKKETDVAPVSAIVTPTSPNAPAVTKHRGVALLWLALAMAGVMAIAALGLWINRSPARTQAAPIQSIAVLPLDNLSGDPSQDYFADAMTEELTSDLGKISALRVISRTSAMHYKKSQKTAPEIAKELNVDSVIEGSVLRSGNRVRITAQLINARPERHLWSESYERDVKDVLALQSELARTIAGQVRAVITPTEQERLQPEAVNPAAYEAYMRGRVFVDRWTPEASAQALRSFEQAAELDTHYALAYVGIAECYVYGVAGVSNEEGLKRGIAAATRALELKPDMGEAHTVLGFLRAESDWDFTGAEVEMKKGIALSPNYTPAHHHYSHLLIDLGRFDESLVEAKKLIELDPVSPTPVGHLAFHYRAARQWDLAIAQYQKELAMDPTLADEHGELGEAYVGKGMFPEAIRELSREVEMSRTSALYPHYLARLGYARALAGDLAGARKILAELPPDDLNDAACVYAGLGDRDKSIALLNESYRRHTFPLEAGFDVELDPLRSDARFNELLRRVHLR